MKTLKYGLPLVVTLLVTACSGPDPAAIAQQLQDAKQDGAKSRQNEVETLISSNSQQKAELRTLRPRVEELEGHVHGLKTVIGFMSDPTTLVAAAGRATEGLKPWERETAHGIASGVTSKYPFSDEQYLGMLTGWVFRGGVAQFQYLYWQSKTALVPYAERHANFIVPSRVVFEKIYDPALAGRAAEIRFHDCNLETSDADINRCQMARKTIAAKYGFREDALPKDALWWLAFLDRRYENGNLELVKVIQVSMLDLIRTINKR